MLRYKNVYWSMPFLFANDIFVYILYKILGENHCIKYVYGTPLCKWAGGRYSNCRLNSIKLIEKILISIKKYNITPTFTFSNTSLSLNDIKDKYCNELLKLISDLDCQIILTSDLLYNHIKQNYQNIKLVSSVINLTYTKIKDIDETEYINNIIDKYDRVVIRPEYAINQNYDFKNIKNISKIELLINQNCYPNCKNSDIHYKIFELFDKKLINEYSYQKCMEKICPIVQNNKIKSNSLTSEQIEKCINAGIKNLKLQGRNFKFEVMLTELFRYYFKENVHKNNIKNNINDILTEKIKDSLELQLHALFTDENNAGIH